MTLDIFVLLIICKAVVTGAAQPSNRHGVENRLIKKKENLVTMSTDLAIVGDDEYL